MSSSVPAAKRRRLEGALHKPFRSPLKTTDNSINPSSSSTSASRGVSSNEFRNANNTSKSVPRTPARTAAKVGQTPVNPLNKPFTPSALAYATTPASAGANEDESGEEDEEQDIEAVMPTSQNTPLKAPSRTSTAAARSNLPSSQQNSESTVAENSTIQTPSTRRGKYPSSRAIPKSAIRSGAITPGSFRTPRTPTTPNSTDPEILALETAVKELESQTRALRSQIDTLRQAEGLPEVVRDAGPVGRLGELMAKWRGVSQEAAEQVFEDVRVRFKDVGGLKGYKRQERERKREKVMEDWAWEKAGTFNTADGQGTQLGGVEEETFDLKAGNALALEIERQAVEEEEEDDDDEEREFDMLAMLEMLHIEPEVIGWDVQKQAWITGV